MSGVHSAAVRAAVEQSRCADEWPTLGDEAYYGLAGDVVRAVDPHTEADPVAVLVSFLAGYGSALGGGPHVVVSGDRHDARIWPVIVGRTSRARKGSSWAYPRQILERADRGWAIRQLSGFGSGEAVVDAVADPDPDDEADVRPADRRLFVHEPEFSRMLRVAARDGSTLSPIARDAWDGRRLQARSRGRTSVASGAHVTVLAHITIEELHRYLSSTEIAGGLANRYAFVLVRRSKSLPGGGNLDDEVLDELAHRTMYALAQARKVARSRRSPDAEALWATMYDYLADEDVHGVYGTVVARAEAQCLRMSIAYAALDGSRTIEVPHLAAAWELWRYCDASARHLFDGASPTGDATADRLLTELRAAAPQGLDHTAQRDLFGRHDVRRVADARRLLVDRGLAEEVEHPTAGRPRTITYATSDQSDRSDRGLGIPASSSLRSQCDTREE